VDTDAIGGGAAVNKSLQLTMKVLERPATPTAGLPVLHPGQGFFFRPRGARTGERVVPLGHGQAEGVGEAPEGFPVPAGLLPDGNVGQFQKKRRRRGRVPGETGVG